MEDYLVQLFKNSDDYCMIFSNIFRNKTNVDYFKKIIDIIIDKCLYYVLDYEDMLENLLCEIDDVEIDKYMENKYDEIINKLNPNSLIFMKANNKIQQDKINNILNTNIYENAKEIVKHQCFDSLNIKSNEYDREFLTYLILDILRNENKNLSDIRYEYGTFSNIYFIGDKVLKIGRRETFRMKNNKRYLKPVLRREILFGDEKICIELTEKVSNDVDIHDLDMVVKELKNQGIYWLDASVDNIGRLIKPNKVYYKHRIHSDNGYIETEDSKTILNAGEIVILDNDHMFEEDNGYIYIKK